MNVVNENEETVFKFQKINRNIWEKLGLVNKKHFMVYGHNDEKLYYSIQKAHMLAFWDIYNAKSEELLFEFTNLSENKVTKPKMGFIYKGDTFEIKKKINLKNTPYKAYQNGELIGQLIESASPLSAKLQFEISEETNIEPELLLLSLHLHSLNN